MAAPISRAAKWNSTSHPGREYRTVAPWLNECSSRWHAQI